jgi:hypothetical protein
LSSQSADVCAPSLLPYCPFRNAMLISIPSKERRRTRTSAYRHTAGEVAGTVSRIRLRRSVSLGAGDDGSEHPCRNTRTINRFSCAGTTIQETGVANSTASVDATDAITLEKYPHESRLQRSAG